VLSFSPKWIHEAAGQEPDPNSSHSEQMMWTMMDNSPELEKLKEGGKQSTHQNVAAQGSLTTSLHRAEATLKRENKCFLDMLVFA
jgi:hypothetical protein